MIDFSPFLLANLLFAGVYALLIWDRVPKVVVVLLGASLAMLFGVLDQATAFRHIDLNVIFLLVGMMIIVNIVQETGAFSWLAYTVARYTRGNGVVLMVTLCLLTALFSAFLDNVTTVMFMAAITCALADTLSINPVPFLISEVMASNIGGTATLIGDPPNILIGSAAGLSFNDFIWALTPVILMIIPVALLTLVWIYRRQLQLPESAQVAILQLDPASTITNFALLKKALAVLGLVLLGFVFHHVIHQEVGTIALAGAAVLMLFEDPKQLWNDVEWDTIFFFMGLFMLVGALVEVGTMDYLGNQFYQWAHGDFKTTTLALLWISGGLSAIIDNIPYTATMIPLIQNLAHHYDDVTPLWWALSLGACLGGNGTLIGATANVVAADIAAYKCGHRIRFLEFMVVGGIITLESLLIATGYVWVRYLVN